VAHAKTTALSKTVRVALSKTAAAKATHSKPVPKAGVVPGTGVPPKAAATSEASVSKLVATVTCSRVGVLKISTGMKRSAAAPSPAAKRKHVKLGTGPPSTSVIPRKVFVQP
jgi:hypothetical protein